MRERTLNWLVTLAMHHRGKVLAASVLLTLALGTAASRMKIDVRWSALLPESMHVVQEYKKIDNNFFQPNNMIVVISGPDPLQLEKITDRATALLEEHLLCSPDASLDEIKETGRYASYIHGKLPEEWLTDHVLRLSKPKDTKRQADLYRDPRLLPFLIHLNDDFEAEYTDSENVKNQEREIVSSLDAVKRFVENIQSAGTGRVQGESIAGTVRDLTISKPYFFSLDNTMSLIMVGSAIPSDDAQTGPLIDKRIEEILAPLNTKYPEYRVERTGLTAISRDEMDSIGPETARITLLALLLVFLLLVWCFRSLLTPILTLIPIIIGIIWSVGVIALTLGEMNLITVMIMVVLLGLGIDFSIHLANRFNEEIVIGQSLERALKLSIEETGSAVVTGAVTTAIAFYMLMIAETRGIDEFGYCAGTGVLITLVAVLLILPVLLAVRADRQAKRDRLPQRTRDFSILGSLAVWMGNRARVVSALLVLLTMAGIWAGTHLSMEWNFLNLEPEGLRSIELQDEIVERFKLSTTASILTTASIEESRFLRKRFKDRAVVGEVDDISLWISRPDFEESRQHIDSLRDALEVPRKPISFVPASPRSGGYPGAAPEAGISETRDRLTQELDRLWANLVEIQALSFIAGQDRIVEKTTQLVSTRDSRDKGMLRIVADLFADQQRIDWQTLDQFSIAFSNLLRNRAIRMTRGDEPVILDMVPERIRARYTSPTMPGFLMTVMPKQNLYEKEDLELFQEVAANIHPGITGDPQLILNMNLATIREGSQAFMASVVLILLVLLIDFRRPFIAVLAFLPLISGIGLLLGLMWLLGEKINYINMIALPVIVGIGVDDGGHFFHRFIQEGRGGLNKSVSSVGRGMLMSSLTTMIGFGSLMLYLMRGMASMGLVLFLGVGTCLLVTFTLLPALASMFEDTIFKENFRSGKNVAAEKPSWTNP